MWRKTNTSLCLFNPWQWTSWTGSHCSLWTPNWAFAGRISQHLRGIRVVSLTVNPQIKKNDRGLIHSLEGRLPALVNPAAKWGSEEKAICTSQCPVVLSFFSADTKLHVCTHTIWENSTVWEKQRANECLIKSLSWAIDIRGALRNS